MIHAHIYPVRVRRRSGRVPTRIGKEPDSDVWRVVEESAGGALEGMVVEDKLLSLAMKDGTATIDGGPLRWLISA